MRRLARRFVGLGLLALNGPAIAQAPAGSAPLLAPQGRPTLSPYLNLTRGGSPAANYYLGVRPATGRDVLDVSGRATLAAPARPTAPGLTIPELPPAARGTGHPAQFLNHSSYFDFRGMGVTINPLAPTNPKAE